jgi:acetyltransferase-like isoleucine patch superfamily enzyme
MKDLILVLCSFFFRLKSIVFGVYFKSGKAEIKFSIIFFKSFLKIKGVSNTFKVSGGCEKSHFMISGNNNVIQATNATIINTSIVISGSNNLVSLEDGVILRKGDVIVRGNNCKIHIGKKTTFGGVRIINVGVNNAINIGMNCLFADHIEIWASDTHSIFDQEGNFINPEKPITIGNNVWVGSHVKILKGVVIGDNSIIGMNTMVTKDILPATLNAGNPIRVLKNDVKWSLEYNIK